MIGAFGFWLAGDPVARFVNALRRVGTMSDAEQESPQAIRVVGLGQCGHPAQAHAGRQLPCARCYDGSAYSLPVDPVWDSRTYWVEPRPISAHMPINRVTLRRDWFILAHGGKRLRAVLWVDDPVFG